MNIKKISSHIITADDFLTTERCDEYI